MNRVGALFFCLTGLFGAEPLFAQDAIPIQRYLMSMRLGDRLKEVQILYPPIRDWPSYREPGGGVIRIQVRRSYAKYFPEDVEMLRLWFRRGRLVHIQAVFDKEPVHKQSLEEIVGDLETMYGEPHRRGMAYLWLDKITVLRASNVEIPAAEGQAVELRTSLEVMEQDVYHP